MRYRIFLPMDISKIWLGLAVRGLALHKTVCTRLQTKRPTLVFLSAFLVFPSHQITKSGLIGSIWFRYDEELTLKTSASSPLKSRTKSDTSTRLTPDFRLSIPHRQGTAPQINLSSVLLQLIKRTTSQSFTAIKIHFLRHFYNPKTSVEVLKFTHELTAVSFNILISSLSS